MWGGNALDDLFLSLENFHFYSPTLPPSPCSFAKSPGTVSLLQRPAHDSSCWVVISRKRCEAAGGMSLEGVSWEGGKGKTRMCSQTASFLLWTPATQPSYRGASVMQFRTTSPRMRREASAHQLPHTSRPSTVKSCHMGCHLIPLPFRRWVDSWAESRDPLVWQLTQGGVRSHTHEAGCCSNALC